MIRLFYSIYKIFLLPHLLCYALSKQKSLIDQDLDRWAEAKKIKKKRQGLLLHFLSSSKDFRSIFYYRIKSPIKHILNLYCRKQTLFTIDITTRLGGGILTGHPYGTILNAETIGDNFYVNHLVTIGEIKGKRPIIGNNVSVFTGAIIIGGITIGNNVNIGAGAVVVKDVPDNSTVVGNPGRIINQGFNKNSKNV